jgi:hypothetical protein
MKKLFRSFVTIAIILIGVTFAQVSFAQPPQPPASGSNGGNNTPMGGAAPVDGGLIFLIAAGIGYGAKKVYNAKFSGKENA